MKNATLSHFSIALYFLLGLFIACSPAAQHKKYLSAEDEAVMELLESIRKNPSDQNLIKQLPALYEQSMNSREQMKSYVLRDNAPGDRWALWARQLEASQYITDAIMKVPAAASVIVAPRYYTIELQDAKSQAAKEYYDIGLEYLYYNNRPYAQKALGMFQEANKMVPGYLDVQERIREATFLSQLVVLVNSVDYYNYGWNYWGLSNDYLQWQMVNDLNRRSYRNVKFYTNEDISRLRLHPEQIIDLRFMRLNVYSPAQNRYQYERTATIPSTGGRPDSTRPANREVKATVFVTSRIVRGDADLMCTVFDQVQRRTVFSEHFPGRYQWEQKTARYTGDSRALRAEDWALINGSNMPDPSRNDIARKLIEDSYAQLINRIAQVVDFNAN